VQSSPGTAGATRAGTPRPAALVTGWPAQTLAVRAPGAPAIGLALSRWCRLGLTLSIGVARVEHAFGCIEF